MANDTRRALISSPLPFGCKASRTPPFYLFSQSKIQQSSFHWHLFISSSLCKEQHKRISTSQLQSEKLMLVCCWGKLRERACWSSSVKVDFVIWTRKEGIFTIKWSWASPYPYGAFFSKTGRWMAINHVVYGLFCMFGKGVKKDPCISQSRFLNNSWMEWL